MADVTLVLKADNSQYITKVKEAQGANQKLHDTATAGTKREKGILEEIEGTLQRLQKARQKAFSYEEIEKYNKKIAETKQHLQEYENAGLKAATATNNMGNTTGKLTTGLIAMAARLLTAVALWRGFKAIMESTNKTADAFRSTLAGLSSGVNYLMKSIVTADFKNLLWNTGLAIKAGKELSNEMNRIGNIERQHRLENLELDKEIEEQRRIFYEDDKTLLTDKLKAGDTMLEKMKIKADNAIMIAKETYRAIVDVTENINKLSEKDLVFAITNFTEVDKLGTAYNELTKIIDRYDKAKDRGFVIDGTLLATWPGKGRFELDGKKFDKVTAEMVAKYRERVKELGPDGPIFGELIKGFEIVTDAEREILTNAMAQIKIAQNQFNVESKRVFRMTENMQDADIQKKKELWDDYFDWWRDHLEKLPSLSDIERKQALETMNDAAAVREYIENLDEEYFKGQEKKIKEQKDFWNDYFNWFTKNVEKIQSEPEKRKEAIETLKKGLDEFVKFAQGITDNLTEAAERRRELLDTQISETQAALETEVELYKAGYASNVAAKKAELETLKKSRDQALIDEEAALKKKRTIEALAQGIDIASSIWSLVKSETKNKGWYGLITAGIAIGAMFALVSSSKKTKYAKGGWTGDGTDRDETGERVAGVVHEKEFVIKRGPAHKFRDVLEAINRDDRKMIFNSFNKLSPELLGGTTVNNVVVENEGPNERLDQVNAQLRQLNRKQNREDIVELSGMTIHRKGNTTRIIKR